MNFTKHFKIKEFNCKDGTPVPPQYLSNAKKVADQLEVLRAALGGRPIIITSGYRTPEHNKKVGGVGGSAHLTASAADIVVRGIPPAQVAATIEKLIDAGKCKRAVSAYTPTLCITIFVAPAHGGMAQKKTAVAPQASPPHYQQIARATKTKPANS